LIEGAECGWNGEWGENGRAAPGQRLARAGPALFPYPLTVSHKSIQNTTASHQQRQQWLSEQALAWSGLPVVAIRPTMFLVSFFSLAGPTVRDRARIELPFGQPAGATAELAKRGRFERTRS
jgi:hypothetical protein